MKFPERENGQAMVELAFATIILFMLLAGIIEFSRIFSAQLVMNHAAREGVRIVLISGKDSDCTDRVDQIMQAVESDPGKYTVTITPTITPTGLMYTVDINYNLPLIMPFSVAVTRKNPLPLKATCSMK